MWGASATARISPPTKRSMTQEQSTMSASSERSCRPCAFWSVLTNGSIGHSSAIRVLRMGTEFLRDGHLRVYREHDADELQAIKRGEWSLKAVQAHAEE